jgi:ligand-binding SRPBCC domain-containing protein
MYQLSTEQFLPITVSEAWSFFSSPKNLSLITPKFLDFKIITNLPERNIYKGMKIDYTVRPLLGIPVHWQTEISDVEEKWKFTDKQIKGPYKIWEHTHYFFKTDKGVLMRDEVNYKLPMGIAGKLMHMLVVKKKLRKIFAYRRKTLTKIFNAHGVN